MSVTTSQAGGESGYETGHEVGYEVIALSPTAQHSLWRSLGRYPNLTDALRARVEDVLQQLVVNDGWLITAEHLVIGPGPDGPATVRTCITQIGADTRADTVPDPFDLQASRCWLLDAHELA